MRLRIACLLTVSSASSQEGSEQTGLLQKMGRGEILVTEVSEESQTRLSKLFDSTSQLLRSGTTPAVISFTRDVLKEIEDAALPAITDSSNIDAQLLNASLAAFTPIRSQYEVKMAEFEAEMTQFDQISSKHNTCREEEGTLPRKAQTPNYCTKFTDCTTKLKELWLDYQLQKQQFQGIHDVITGGICPTAKPWGTFPQDWKLGTEYQYDEAEKMYTWQYRTNIETYTREGAEYFKAKDAYEAQNKLCVLDKTGLNAKTSECDGLKTSLETKSCSGKNLHKEWQDVFDETWKLAQENLASNINNVRQQEHDRKIEYQSIKSVQCLLERINSTGGMPCDDTMGNGTADAQIAQCRIIDITTSWLNLTYPDEPGLPVQTSLTPHACQAAFVTQEYGPMVNKTCGVSDVGDSGAWVVQLLKPICDVNKTCEETSTTVTIATATTSRAIKTPATLVTTT